MTMNSRPTVLAQREVGQLFREAPSCRNCFATDRDRNRCSGRATQTGKAI